MRAYNKAANREALFDIEECKYWDKEDWQAFFDALGVELIG